jgi:hypothetical protein
LLVAAALAASSGAAWATDPKPTGSPKASPTSATPTVMAPQGSTDEKAMKWISMGNKAFKDGKFADAEKAYGEAFLLKPVYDIAGNLAMAEFAQSKHRAAAEHLAFALRQFPITGEPSQREQMEKTFNQCTGHVGAVKVTVSTSRGAQVSVDGKPVGEAPLADDLFLEPGKHTISVTAKGYKDASKEVEVKKGGTARVQLDPVLLPPQVVMVKGAEAPPPPPRSKKPAVALGVVAVVALGAGGALLGVGFGKKSDAGILRDQILQHNGGCAPVAVNPDKAKCTDLNDQLESSYLLQNIGGVSLAVGGAAAIAAVTYLVWPASKGKKEPSAPLKVTPIAGLEQRGILISGTF